MPNLARCFIPSSYRNGGPSARAQGVSRNLRTRWARFSAFLPSVQQAHTVSRPHPWALRSLAFFLSRALFRSNFGIQYSWRDFGKWESMHPGC